MAGAPYRVDCAFSDDETPEFSVILTASDGSVLDTSTLTFEYVVNRDGCAVFTGAEGSGITVSEGIGRLTFTIPAGTLSVGKHTHGCRFTGATGSLTQLFDGGITIAEGEF